MRVLAMDIVYPKKRRGRGEIKLVQLQSPGVPKSRPFLSQALFSEKRRVIRFMWTVCGSRRFGRESTEAKN